MQNNALGKVSVFGPLFWVRGWPYRAKNGVRVLTCLPMFTVSPDRTLFRRSGPRVSLIRTFSKTQRSYSNFTPGTSCTSKCSNRDSHCCVALARRSETIERLNVSCSFNRSHMMSKHSRKRGRLARSWGKACCSLPNQHVFG